MRVLVVSPYPVRPVTHGGRARAWGLATGLAHAGARVDVLSPWIPGARVRAGAHDGVRVRPYVLPANALPRLLPERRVPPLVALSWPPAIAGSGRLVRGFARYDVVQVEFCARPSWLERCPPGPRRVYSAHNVERDYAATVLGASPRAIRRVEELERRTIAASDLVLVTTRADADRLEELYGPGVPTAIVPHGSFVLEDTRERDALRAGARSALGLADGELALVFLGGPAPHNREAAAFLEREVAPRLDGRATLLLAGGCATDRPPRGAVRRLGFVEDLVPLLSAADVGLSPAALGAGQSLKVVDYLSAGLPVLATRVGARGLDGHPGVTTVERERFAAAVLELTAGRDGLTRNGDGELSWRARGRMLHERLSELVDG